MTGKKQIIPTDPDVNGDSQRIETVFRTFTIMLLVGLAAGFVVVLSHQDYNQAAMVGGAFLPVLVTLLFIKQKNLNCLRLS